MLDDLLEDIETSVSLEKLHNNYDPYADLLGNIYKEMLKAYDNYKECKNLCKIAKKVHDFIKTRILFTQSYHH